MRKFLNREGQFLLAELCVPDARTLLWRIVFWILFYGTTTAALLGLVWIFNVFGSAAGLAVVFLLIMVCLQMERRMPIYYSDGDPLVLGGDKPALPPPGTRSLPAPSPRRISHSRGPALPGPKK
jgi:hypothetical protein